MKTRKAARSSPPVRHRNGVFFPQKGSVAQRPFFQAQLEVGAPGDRFEREADAMADQVVQRMQSGGSQERTAPSIQAKCTACQEEELQRQSAGDGEEPLQGQGAAKGEAPPSVGRGLEQTRGGGRPLATGVRDRMEDAFGRDFSGVRVHTGGAAERMNRELGSRAFTHGHDVYFNAGELDSTSTAGSRLLAHELTHVVQQGAASREEVQRQPAPEVQREPDRAAAQAEPLDGPLTDAEWRRLELWQARGEVGIEPLTGDPDHNALVVADALFCSRFLGSPGFMESMEDPLLCVIPEVTRADPRVRRLAQLVGARGPIVNWVQVDPDRRILHVMRLLVDQYGLPANGAAGLVGNLISESGVLPTKIESTGRIPDAGPLTERDFAGRVQDFTAEEVMNRDPATRRGPRRPGIGLAQWTSAPRRQALFQHTFQGRQLGASILFNMEAQVDFLVNELQSRYAGVYGTLTRAGVSVEDASDDVLRRFEAPRSVLDAQGHLRPKNDPAIQGVLNRRRGNARRALRIFNEAE